MGQLGVCQKKQFDHERKNLEASKIEESITYKDVNIFVINKDLMKTTGNVLVNP